MQNNKSSPILVTGATGFVASHLIKLLLEKGFKVRGTVRSLAKKESYEFLYNLVPEKKNNLELVEATLDERSGWPSAIEGCEYIFHLASPIPKNTSTNDADFVKSTVSGVTYILETSLEKGVKKVVYTSSLATIAYGNPSLVITEDAWSDEKVCDSYALSKVKAEKFVWDFYERHKDKIQIAVVNPVIVLGPVFTKADNTTVSILGDMLKGTSTGIMDAAMAVIDVRDAAESHFQVMFNEVSTGKRYIASGGDVHWGDIVRTLKEEFGKKGFNIPDQLVTKEDLIERGTPIEKSLLSIIGVPIKVSNERIVRDLNLKFRTLRESVVDAANSLIEVGLVANPGGKI